jgi:hypothetical protein
MRLADALTDESEPCSGSQQAGIEEVAHLNAPSAE